MTPRRLLHAIACISFATFLVRCGSSATCEDCDGPTPVGLTVFTPETLATGACAPAQVVQLDDGVTVRPSVPVKLSLSGDTSWYADPDCLVTSPRVTQAAGERGAVAYFTAGKTGRLEARVRGEVAGGQAVVQAAERSGAGTGLTVASVRYADVSGCSPVYVSVADSGGRPANVANDVTVALAAPATLFFATPSCGSQLSTVTLGAQRQSTIAYARFGAPGDVTITATASGLTNGTTRVDVAGDPQLRLGVQPEGDALPVQAGECKAFALSIVDPTGAVFAVDAMPVTFGGTGTSVFSDSSCAAPITSTVIRGTAPTTVYVQATEAGSATAAFAISDVQVRTIGLAVTAGAPSRLRLSGPARLALGGCYPYVVARTDAYGNAVKGPAVTATITSGLSLFSDAACAGAATTSAAIADSSTFGRFYVRGASLTTAAALHTEATGLAADSITVAVVAAATSWRFDFTQAVGAGDCTSATLVSVDGSGTPSDTLTAATATFSPSSPSLVAYRDAACASPIASLEIPALGKSASFYLSSSVVGAYTLGATGTTLGAVPARAIDVRAAAPASITTVAASRIGLAACVPVQMLLRDRFGNASPIDRTTTLSLVAPAQGQYFMDAACTTPATDTTVAIGSDRAIVYYRGHTIGPELFRVVVNGLTSSPASSNVSFLMSDVNASAAALPVVASIAFDPIDSTVMWLQTQDGMTWRSSDSGASWASQCKTPSPSADYGVGVFVSPGPDGHAYTDVDLASAFYRIDDLGGAACPAITSTLSSVYAYYVASGLTVDSTGRLLAWSGCCGDTNLYVSDDFGDSWEQLYDDTQSTAWMGFGANHPTDPLIKLVDRAFAGENGGLYRSIDGGAHWTFVTASGFNDTSYDIKFDPAHAGYVYKYGRVSADNGVTWNPDAGYNGLSLSWGLDATGAAYRFQTYPGTSTIIERAPDARTPVWAALTSSITVPFNDQKTRMAVFASGQSIAVRAGGFAYRTDDAAATPFTRLDAPGSLTGYPLTIAAAGPRDGYAVGNTTWLALATHDGGELWEPAGAAGNGTKHPVIHTNPNYPLSVYVRAEVFNSTYDTNVMASQDGFATVTNNPNGTPSSWATVAGVSLADPLVFMSVGGSCQRTIDGGATYQTRSCPGAGFVWYPSPLGWVSPANRDVMWYAGYDFRTQGLWEVSWATGVITDITSRTGVAPAGLEMFGTGPYVVRVVSANGALVSSTNLTASFDTPTPASAEATCNNRVIASLPGSPQVVAHGCIGQNTVVLSRDSGSTWRRLPLDGCGLSQLAVFEQAIVASCATRSAQTVTY